MPRLNSDFIADRNRRIRRDAEEGRPIHWLTRAYGLSKGTVYRICRDVPIGELSPRTDEPLAEWEIELLNEERQPQRRFGPRPSRAWVDSLRDATNSEPCVYFVQEDRPLGAVKIGASSAWQLKERLRGLQIGNPARLKLRRMVAGDYATEAALHSYFASLWIRGEWFRPDDELARVARAVMPSDVAA